MYVNVYHHCKWAFPRQPLGKHRAVFRSRLPKRPGGRERGRGRRSYRRTAGGCRVKAHHERTTLLLNRELFDGRAEEHGIADALLGSTVRLVADRESLASRAGQAVLVTAVTLVARLGIGIQLVAPNVALLDRVAPRVFRTSWTPSVSWAPTSYRAHAFVPRLARSTRHFAFGAAMAQPSAPPRPSPAPGCRTAASPPVPRSQQSCWRRRCPGSRAPSGSPRGRPGRRGARRCVSGS
jgi:hypothetical protein